MAVKLRLCLLLLLLLNLSWAQEHRCKQSHFSCDKCIQTGPECAWCSSANATVRCHTLEELQKAGCTDVYNPQSSVEILKNESRPAQINTIFMQPQALSIHVRPGINQTVQLNVFMPADYPTSYVTLEYYNNQPGVNVAVNRKKIKKSGIIEVSVDAVQCFSRNQNMNGLWFVFVDYAYPQNRVKLEIHLECHCGCLLNREEKSAACSSRGARVCGHCECEQPYAGENCQMEERQEDPLVVREDESCRPNPDAPLCSGKGTCVQGVCECDKLIDPNHIISGQYCECDNFSCSSSNNKICGGNGRCECHQCICDPGWSDEACDCSSDVTPCLALNDKVCNGRGVCTCGTCQCTTPQYQGPTCENCPLCPGVCAQFRDCVECRAFGTGEMASRCDKECNYFSTTMVDTEHHLPQGDDIGHCRERASDDCFFLFTILRTRTENNVTVVRARNCPVPWYHIG